MPTKNSTNRRRACTSAGLLLMLVLALAAPAALARGVDEAPPMLWLERLVAQIAQRLGIGPGESADVPERAPRDARQRHHLTIEPGGDAIPPPPGDGDGPPASG